MTKREVLNSPTSCLNRAADDEPIFVLRAKDPLAASVIRFWAAKAEVTRLHEPEKITQARLEAEQVIAWRDRQDFLVP